MTYTCIPSAKSRLDGYAPPQTVECPMVAVHVGDLMDLEGYRWKVVAIIWKQHHDDAGPRPRLTPQLVLHAVGPDPI